MWLEVLYWIDHVWSSIECVCCACDPSQRLDAPSICFVCVCVCRKLSLSFRILRTELNHTLDVVKKGVYAAQESKLQ